MTTGVLLLAHPCLRLTGVCSFPVFPLRRSHMEYLIFIIHSNCLCKCV